MGTRVGPTVGSGEGLVVVGVLLGVFVGPENEGLLVGTVVSGDFVGKLAVGFFEGSIVVEVGLFVGFWVGDLEGAKLGSVVEGAKVG